MNLTLALAAWLLSANPECQSVVVGRAIDAATGEALRRVTVTVGAEPAIETSADGRYRKSNLCPGAVKIQARRADYRPRTVTTRIPPEGVVQVDLLLEPFALTRLGERVVEAPRIAGSDMRATAELSGDALARTRGKHLADAVAEIPGVTVLRSGGTAKPVVRGQSGARVLVLYDGVRHEGQDWGLNHGTEIDPFTAGSISVVKGAAGVRYGPDAIAGVLLVDPPELLSTPGLRGEIDLVGAWNGRRGTAAGRIDAVPSLMPELTLRLEGNYSRGRALETPLYPLDNTGIEEWNLGGTARYTRSGFELTLSFHHLDIRTGLCTCLRIDSPGDFRTQVERGRPLAEPLFTTDADIERPFQKVTHDRALAKVETDVLGLGDLELNYAFQLNLREEFDVVRRGVVGPQADFTLRTHSLDALFRQAPATLGPGLRLEGIAGLAFMFQENLFEGLPLIPNFRAISGGAFAVQRLVLHAVELEAGARFDFMERETFLAEPAYGRHIRRGTLREGDCEQSGGPARCQDSFQVGSFTIGALWRPLAGLTAELDLSSASRFPTMDEQYLNGTAASFPVLGLGAPNLGPETSWSLSGTLSGNWEPVRAEVSVFGSYIDDYIYFAPEIADDGNPVVDVLVAGAFPRFSYRAVNALFWGFDGGISARLGPFDLGVDGSLVRARDVENDAFLVFIPPDRIRGSASWRLPDLGPFFDTRLGLSGTYVARQHRFDVAADLAPPPDAYGLLGVTMETQWRVDEQLVRLSVEGQNLLNNRYRDYTSLLRYFADEPGLQVMVRLGAVFGD